MENKVKNKIQHGQFFTTVNPFNHPAFKIWAEQFTTADIICEPFAGSNNIVKMLQEVGFANQFASFDIEPQAPEIVQQNTIANFPAGYRVVITNPPYLAKNSATQKGFTTDFEGFEDLYQLSIRKCLDNAEFVAAIIPLSFVNSEMFRDCLQTVISLPQKMFTDTDCPVCLALFRDWTKSDGDGPCEDFMYYIGNLCFGYFSEIDFEWNYQPEACPMKFNIADGAIGLFAVDNTKTASVRFVPGEDIPAEEVKTSNRSFTRIQIEADNIDAVIHHANKILEQQRKWNGDAFMTPFKGLRSDGQYRQRLSWKSARQILEMAVQLSKMAV